MKALNLEGTGLIIHNTYSSGRTVCACPNPIHSKMNNNLNVFVDPALISKRGIVSYCWSCKETTKSLTQFKNLMRKYSIKINIGDIREIEVKQVQDHDEKIYELTNYPLAYDNKYLMSRGVTNEQVDKYNIKYGNEKIVFERWYNNILDGVTVRFTNPNMSIRYFDYGSKAPFGIDHLDRTKNEIFIVEGIFGVLNLDRMGYQAIGVLGNSNYLYKDIIGSFRVVHLGLDNDDAGLGAAIKIKKLIPTAYCLPYGEYDELTKEEFDDNLKNESMMIPTLRR